MSVNSCAHGTARTTAPVPLSWACPLLLPVQEKGTVPRHLEPRTEDSLVCSEAAVRERDPSRAGRFYFLLKAGMPPRGPPCQAVEARPSLRSALYFF